MASDGTVTIRLAGLEDAPAIGKMAFWLLQEIDTPKYSTEQYAEAARSLLADDSGFCVLLAFPVDGPADEPIGMLTLSEGAALYTCGRYGEVQELFIADGHRGRKVGSRLIDAAKEVALKNGWERLQLHVSRLRDGGRSHGFYQRYGFEDSGTTMRYRLTSAAG